MIQSIANKSRRGVALVMALVLIAVLSLILGVVTLQVVSERKLIHDRQRHLQAAWLARSGVELAAARLLKSPDGFKAIEEKLLADAKVAITVEKTDKGLYTVSVEAEVGPEEEKLSTSTANVRLRRIENEGRMRIQIVAMDKN
jgi:hypothetical protein